MKSTRLLGALLCGTEGGTGVGVNGSGLVGTSVRAVLFGEDKVEALVPIDVG